MRKKVFYIGGLLIIIAGICSFCFLKKDGRFATVLRFLIVRYRPRLRWPRPQRGRGLSSPALPRGHR